jgi:hypothetical protein
MAPNPNSPAPAIRGYRANESSARELISTIPQASEKKLDVLAAWNGFKIEVGLSRTARDVHTKY